VRRVVLRVLLFVHRWLGVALCVLFLLWFPTGIVMMYWDYPNVTPADRIERAAALRADAITVSLPDALAASGVEQPRQVRLSTFDGRPVYRFRSGRDEAIVYADTGELQEQVTRAMADRIAAAWTSRSVSRPDVDTLTDVDQWTLQQRAAMPLWKYSWDDGQELYISQSSGEVVQHTTRSSRFWAWLGAIPHWFYFTPLRKHGPQWSSVVIWSSAFATGSALIGIVIGLWMYSPAKRYRYAGKPTSIPYRGQKRWHTVFGLIFGLGAATWAFSGMLSMDPFPTPTGGDAGGRVAPVGEIQQALRGRLQVAAFAPRSPRQALEALRDTAVKEIELVTVGGSSFYIATLSPADSRVVPIDGAPAPQFDPDWLMNGVSAVAGANQIADARVIDTYDRYYLDRRSQRPLPVVMVRFNDSAATRIYLDPKTARIVGGHDAGDWMNRWLYHGLHSLDFPWLYAYRPLWDVVVITFMVGGTALCVTSLVLAWRVVGRKLSRLAGNRSSVADPDDLVPQTQ
jgi:hypothetical protein